MKLKKYLLIIIYCTVLPELVSAQGCCCGGGGAMGTSITRYGLETIDAKSLQLLLAYDFNNMNSLFDEDKHLESAGNQRIIHSGIFMANYGISRRWSVAGIMPYIAQELGTTSLDGRKEVDYIYGLGDMIMMIKYRIINPLAFNGWGIYAGIGPKLPTGSTSQINAAGSLYPMDIQPGTGTLDAISWLSFSKSHFIITNLYLNSGATFRLAGQNRHYRDSLTYSPGNEFQYSAGLDYSFYGGLVFDLFSYVQYRYQAMSKLSGEPIERDGGHWLSISPGIRVNFTQKFSFIMTSDIPVYRYLNGPQLTTSYRFSIALTYNFASWKPIEITPDQ
jgi:hypothetical protein